MYAPTPNALKPAKHMPRDQQFSAMRVATEDKLVPHLFPDLPMILQKHAYSAKKCCTETDGESVTDMLVAIWKRLLSQS